MSWRFRGSGRVRPPPAAASSANTIAAPTTCRLRLPLPLAPILLLLLVLLPPQSRAAATTAAFAFSQPLGRAHRALLVGGAAVLARGGSASSSRSRPLLFVPAAGTRGRGRLDRAPTTRLFAASASTSTMATGSLLLPFRPDSYNGVIIDPTQPSQPHQADAEQQSSPPPTPFPTDPEAFGRALDESLAAWKVKGKRGVWLKLPLSLASHVPAAAARGFVYHHAEPNFLMMTTWLPEDDPSTLPPGPTHQVGVGALVLDATGTRVLAVQEKSGPLKGTGIWKLPTGLLDAGEDLGEGAEREVKEETGIATRFRSLLAFRHAHGFAFGKSDLFFLARLDVVGDPTPTPCPREIEACEWIPLDELVSQPRFRASPLYSCVYDLCQHHAKATDATVAHSTEGLEELVSLTPIWGTRLPMGFRPGSALLYHTSEAHHRERHQEEEGEGEEGEGGNR